MGGLLDDIKAEQEASKINRCCLHRVSGELAEQDYADLMRAVDEPTIPVSVIQRAMLKRGVKLDPKGLGAHRKGTCACARG